MRPKKIETLVKDIHDMLERLNDGEEITDDDIVDEYIDIFVANVRSAIKNQLSPRTSDRKPKVIYASEAGKPCHRAVWFAITGAERLPLPPGVKVKFMQGDFLEELLALLARLAGHTVTNEQDVVEIDLPKGWKIRGRMDYKIDGTLVDAKSASPNAFKKFVTGDLVYNDGFGYMSQLGTYVEHEGDKDHDAGFLAIDKSSCDITLFQPDIMDLMAAIPDYDVLVDDLESPIGPDREFDDEPWGDQGNRKLGFNCSYCDYKKVCWADANRGKGLRHFKYKSWPFDVYLTHTQVKPKVQELKL